MASIAATFSSAAAPDLAPSLPAAPAPKRGFRLGLRFKFTLTLTLFILVIMGVASFIMPSVKLFGEFVRVKIIGHTDYDLIAEPV